MYQKLYNHQKKDKKLSIVESSPKKQANVDWLVRSPKKSNKVQVSKDAKKLSTFVKHDKLKDQDNSIYCMKCNLVCKSVSELQKHKMSCFKGK